MKHIKSMNEVCGRVVGFKYSKPNDRYKMTLWCIEIDDDPDAEKDENEETGITVEKINKVLKNISDLYYDEKSITVTVTECDDDSDPNIKPDAVVRFEMSVYNDSEIVPIMQDISEKLYSIYNIEVLKFLKKRQYNLK
jgi:hypothetical protein